MVLNIVFFLVTILFLAIIYIFLRRRIDRLTDPDRISTSLAGDLDIILSEINQATERNILVIEDKIKELEDIIETAEKRITLLKKTVSKTDVGNIRPAEKTLTQKAAAAAETSENQKAEQLSLDIPAEDGVKTTGELTYSHLSRINMMSGMVTPLSVPEKTGEESEDIKKKVVSLHRNGIDPSIIASNVGINRGEVELIISLYTQVSGGQD